MASKIQQRAIRDSVAEVQGLYGPYSFPEKLLQKIWLRGDFDRSSASLLDGRSVAVRQPGKWNLLGGPDFRGARLKFGAAPEITGDVELHLHAVDWAGHGHAKDPAYDRVVLHVVLFPPPPGHVTKGAGGEIPVLVLLPLLHHDLEQFAAEEAVEALAGRTISGAPKELAALKPEELTTRLRALAQERWRQKIHFACLRIQRLGWEGACHHTALEILGYRFNRAPMLRVAGRWPLAEWKVGTITFAGAFEEETDAWSVQGVRPANHPRTRLRQYEAWVRTCPDWPAQLLAGAWSLNGKSPENLLRASTRAARRTFCFAARRKEFAALTGGRVGGSRLDTLISDGFLPLLAANGDADAELHGLWFHWFAGDLPLHLARALRALGVCDARESPLAVGPAQGLLGWWIAHDARG